MIRKDGYYISEMFQLVDWHAGHKFEENKYYLLKFLDNTYSIRASNDNTKISNSIFKARHNFKDKYKILDKNTLEITIDPESKWSVIKHFTIVSSELLLDENLKEYRFVSMNKLV